MSLLVEVDRKIRQMIDSRVSPPPFSKEAAETKACYLLAIYVTVEIPTVHIAIK